MESKVFTEFEPFAMRTCAYKVPVMSVEEFKELLTLDLKDINLMLKGRVGAGIAKVHPNERNKINKKLGAEVAISRIKDTNLDILRMTTETFKVGRRVVLHNLYKKDGEVRTIFISEWDGMVRVSLDLR